jgi:hypothetical protein
MYALGRVSDTGAAAAGAAVFYSLTLSAEWCAASENYPVQVRSWAATSLSIANALTLTTPSVPLQVCCTRAWTERLPASIRWEVEVPVSRDVGDQRAWDAVVTVGTCKFGLEFVTRFHDCQAQLRQFQLKLWDAAVDRLIVVAKGSHANRRALSGARGLVDTLLPLGTRSVMAALSRGDAPGQNGLVPL